MAENSNPAPKRKRGPGKPWKKGQSGNPGGRAKRTEELASSIREMDADLRNRLQSIALRGEHKDSIAAIKLLWAYGHGNPVQAVTGPEGEALKIGVIVLPAEAE